MPKRSMALSALVLTSSVIRKEAGKSWNFFLLVQGQLLESVQGKVQAIRCNLDESENAGQTQLSADAVCPQLVAVVVTAISVNKKQLYACAQGALVEVAHFEIALRRPFF
mmetsp:Transcript_81976/g.206241  ORF Transcript_81976/g.206241 Transcript_81976/m.206241 type:complete len:110 (+) Transcript_81976:840-1169(+)